MYSRVRKERANSCKLHLHRTTVQPASYTQEVIYVPYILYETDFLGLYTLPQDLEANDCDYDAEI